MVLLYVTFVMNVVILVNSVKSIDLVLASKLLWLVRTYMDVNDSQKQASQCHHRAHFDVGNDLFVYSTTMNLNIAGIFHYEPSLKQRYFRKRIMEAKADFFVKHGMCL